MTAFMWRWLSVLLLYATVAAWAGPAAPRIVVLGDSLSAAYGIPASEAWVALLQRRLEAQGYPHRVINASLSGETTAGGLARLPAALDQHRPQFVLIELGGNDGLRGLPLTELRANLQKMLALARKAGATPLLFEMRLPPNYGPAYADRFAASFRELAEAESAALVPFLLADIALDRAAFQDDGIHPGVAVQGRLLDVVWPVLQPLLGARTAPARSSG